MVAQMDKNTVLTKVSENNRDNLLKCCMIIVIISLSFCLQG